MIYILLMVKVSCKQVNLVIIHVYFPTSGYNDENIEEMNDQIKELLALTFQKDNIIIMDNFNAVVGES